MVIKFNNKVVTFDDKWVQVDSYNPLNLPPFTIRAKFEQGYTPTIADFPTFPRYRNADSITLVDASDNVWDITMNDTNWNALFCTLDGTWGPYPTPLLEILGANSTGVTTMINMFADCPSLTSIPLFDTSSVTGMDYMFYNCHNLTSVPLFDTSNVTGMSFMFTNCYSLTSVPLFDTSNVTNMKFMFYMYKSGDKWTYIPLIELISQLTSVPLFDTSKVTDMASTFFRCVNVESGALALYQQASTQANVPNHTDGPTFYNCGSNTVTGAAELAQIPSGWK